VEFTARKKHYTHEGKYRKSARLSRLFWGTKGGIKLHHPKFLNNISKSGGRHLHQLFWKKLLIKLVDKFTSC